MGTDPVSLAKRRPYEASESGLATSRPLNGKNWGWARLLPLKTWNQLDKKLNRNVNHHGRTGQPESGSTSKPFRMQDSMLK